MSESPPQADIAPKIFTKEEIEKKIQGAVGLKNILNKLDDKNRYSLLELFYKIDPAYIELITDLTEQEINDIIIVDLVDSMIKRQYDYDGVLLSVWRRDKVVLAISKNRGGRGEMVRVLASQVEEELTKMKKWAENFTKVR